MLISGKDNINFTVENNSFITKILYSDSKNVCKTVNLRKVC